MKVEVDVGGAEMYILDERQANFRGAADSR